MTSTWNQYFPPKPEWSIDDVPDQSGKVFLVTGGNTGLGFATAKVLLARNARVYITSRDRDKGRRAVDELRKISEAIRVLHLDLSDLYSVRRAADEFMSKEHQLHVLINNAGIMSSPIVLLTRQRYDLQFGVNVLGHFYLTQLLLPVLLATARATGQKVRVINYSSLFGPDARIDYTTLMDGPVRRKCSPAQLYRQSKLANLLFALGLAEQYGEQGIVSSAINPGNVHTGLSRHTGAVTASIWDMFSHSVSKGILTPLFAATSPKADLLNGKLLIPWARLGQVPASVLERCAQENLWDWLEAQTDCFERMNHAKSDSTVFLEHGIDNVSVVSVHSKVAENEALLI
ncbi:NAD(P)-binding protein [Dichomitus squalens LYAD-421 SS1]|uniref:NAD(P)-binding protein n=1 Tax=Dichomitus squalens (strain LYAD-421) TaxID=732165 RepID=R7SQ09_DICSQ|nr:NAD(P)-binding protein [Dichomitus squalens LYAD-421 SS1]EJF58259.1 NAD(P)-binding protein [Dichomitus squalens LYAD-421 SS1]